VKSLWRNSRERKVESEPLSTRCRPYRSTHEKLSDRSSIWQRSILERTLYMAPEFFNYFLLTLTIRRGPDRKVLASVDLGIPVTGVAVHYHAASFGEDDPASADIPGPASAFPVQIESAACDSTEVEGRRSHAAHRMDHRAAVFPRLSEALESADFRLPILSTTVGTPLHADESVSKAAQWLDLGAFERKLDLTIQVCTLATYRGIKRLSKWIVDHTDHWGAFNGEAERNT